MTEYKTTGSLNMADWPREAKEYTKALEAELARLSEELKAQTIYNESLADVMRERDRLREENRILRDEIADLTGDGFPDALKETND